MESLGNSLRSILTEPVVYTAAVSATVGSLYLLQKWFQGGTCYCEARLDGKTVVITGANDGIGKYTAFDMARRGARVLMCCRDMDKALAAAQEVRRDTGNGNVVVKKLDLASLKSVRACAADILTTEDRIDILINNAGVMACPQWKTEDGFEMQFGVNHLGHFLFTLLLLDLIKKSAPSRIVNVSSSAHSFASKFDFDDLMYEKNYKPWRAYGRSKAANILFTKELARRLQGHGVSSFSLHPGAIPTSLSRYMPTIFRLPYLALSGFVLKTISQGAQTTIYCAVTPGLEAKTGLYFSDCQVKTTSAVAWDDSTAARLWDVSEKLVGLRS